MEGRQTVRPEGPSGPTPILPPTIDHPHSEAASITGGYVYRGSRLKDWPGTYLYGDYQSGKVWGLRLDGGAVTWAGPLARHRAGARLLGRGPRRGDIPGGLQRTHQLHRLVGNPATNRRAASPAPLSQTGLFRDAGSQPAPA